MLVRVMPNYTRRQSYLYTIVRTPCSRALFARGQARSRSNIATGRHDGQRFPNNPQGVVVTRRAGVLRSAGIPPHSTRIPPAFRACA